jgi:hypothetical protein
MFTSKGDVWSFGVVLWEIATLGYAPYPTHRNAEISGLLMEGYRMPNPGCPREFYDVMLNAWALEERDRPDFPTLRRMLVKFAKFSQQQLQSLLGESYEEVKDELYEDGDGAIYEDIDANTSNMNPMLDHGEAYLVPSTDTMKGKMSGRRWSGSEGQSGGDGSAGGTLSDGDDMALYDQATEDGGGGGGGGATSFGMGTMSDGDDMALYDQATEDGDGSRVGSTSFGMGMSLQPVIPMSDGDDGALYDQATEEVPERRSSARSSGKSGVGYLDTAPNKSMGASYHVAAAFSEDAYDAGTMWAGKSGEEASVGVVENMYSLGDGEGGGGFGIPDRASVSPPQRTASKTAWRRPKSVKTDYEPASKKSVEETAYALPDGEQGGKVGNVGRSAPAQAGDVSFSAVGEVVDDFGRGEGDVCDG